MPVLGDRYLTSITTELCQSIINNSIKVRHNTINTTSGILRLMRSLFNYAIYKKYINKSNDSTQDVTRSITALKIKKPRPVYCLPQEEIDAIFDRFKNTRYYMPLLLGYRCGLRKGEVFGLTVEDVMRH